jgi:hypothetical protein
MPIPWGWLIAGIIGGWLFSQWFGGGGQQPPAIDMNFIFIMIMMMLFLVLLITVL